MSTSVLADQTVPAINRLFVSALLALAEAGRAEQACRLAAKGWSTLRHSHSREAERLSAALHGLTRYPSVASPREVGVTHG